MITNEETKAIMEYEKQVNQFMKELKNNPDLCQYLLFHYSTNYINKNKGVKK